MVDEVDSILIDEARTPLIISGPAEDSSEMYESIDKLIPLLKKQDKEDSQEYRGDGHYTVDEKSKQAYLTENGQIFIEELLILTFTCYFLLFLRVTFSAALFVRWVRLVAALVALFTFSGFPP